MDYGLSLMTYMCVWACVCAYVCVCVSVCVCCTYEYVFYLLYMVCNSMVATNMRTAIHIKTFVVECSKSNFSPSSPSVHFSGRLYLWNLTLFCKYLIIGVRYGKLYYYHHVGRSICSSYWYLILTNYKC